MIIICLYWTLGFSVTTYFSLKQGEHFATTCSILATIWWMILLNNALQSM